MIIRHYHDFHTAVNSGAMEDYLIIQKDCAGLYSITGHINGDAVSATDDYRTLRNIMKRRHNVTLPKLAELPFNFRLSNIFGYSLRTTLLYINNDGVLAFVPRDDD